MREILIVPDVHGRNFWTPALDYQGEVIFLGDYVDPYPQDGLSDKDGYETLLKVVDFKQKNPSRVTLLIGNHELHYFDPNFSAGRYSREYAPKYKEVLTGEGTAALFQLCKQVDNYLFIHAGITADWYKRHRRDYEALGATLEEQMNNVFLQKKHIFHEAGMQYRGGLDDSGSPLWADYREYGDEPEPFDPNIIQIIGHTQILEDEPIFLKNIRLLDNRQLYILRGDTIEKYKK
jgi:hypothetical protein